MTPSEVVMSQLLAARAAIDVAIALMDVPVAPKVDVPTVCEHPESKRVAMPTSGKLSQFMCRACAVIVNPEASDGA